MKVIKVGAEWCSGCLIMKPRWAEIEKENPRLVTEYFDFDRDKKMIDKYKIKSEVLPVFVFLDKNGKEIERRDGELSKKELLKLIERYRDK